MVVIARDPGAHLPSLKPNKAKILEAILFLIGEAERAGSFVTQYDIAKSIFIADWFHLQQYGRPISFDNYAAMENGPVPSTAYDMLKPSHDWGPEGAPWQTAPAPEAKSNKAVKYVRPVRSANLRKLSESDIAKLREALSLVKEKGFFGTRDFTHELEAYKRAWDARGSKGSMKMDYRLLVDEPELVDDLVHASYYL